MPITELAMISTSVRFTKLISFALACATIFPVRIAAIAPKVTELELIQGLVRVGQAVV